MDKLLRVLIFIHIYLISYQLIFRQIIFETTLYRDFLLILIFGIWGVNSLLKKKFLISFQDKLTNSVLMYFFYGFVIVFFFLVQNVNLIDTLVAFRNHFFPVILFFVSKKVFKNSIERKTVIKFLFIFFNILAFNIVLEWLFMSFKVDMSVFPWYRFTFSTSNRYLTGPEPDFNAVNPSDSPLLGILGWGHATSALFVALFSFLIPLIRYNSFFKNKLISVNSYHVIFFAFSCIILGLIGVKTSLISILIIFFIFLYKHGNINFKKFLPATCLIILLAFLTRNLWSDYIIEKINAAFVGDENGSIFTAIFNADVFRFVLLDMAKSPIKFLFGGDISSLLENAFLELRLLLFTVNYGVIWLFLFLRLNYVFFKKAISNFYSADFVLQDRYFSLSIYLLIIAYLLDSLHYARIMYYPNIDIYFVLLGVFSNVKKQELKYNSN